MQSGLVLDIQFEDQIGTTATDNSRYSNNGTITPGLGKWIKDGYYFGGNSSVAVTTVPILKITPSIITLIAWIKSGTVSEMAILDKCDDGDAPTKGYALRTDASGHLVFTTNADEYDSATLITDNQNHFIAGVLDGVNKSIYIDGKLILTKAYSTAITDSVKNLGIGYQVNPEIYFTGNIYICQIYNKPTYYNEIVDIYESQKHRFK